jgi:hypothetical protein
MRRWTRVLSAAAVAGLAGPLVVPEPVSAQLVRASDTGRLAEVRTTRSVRGAITGVVSDERGGPLAGAMVSALGEMMAMAVTDKDGRFLMESLPAGEYTLRAHLSGFAASSRAKARVVASQSAVHRLQLRRLDAAVGTTGVPVEAPTGRPILTAGLDEPPVERPEAETTGAKSSDDHSHDEIAWRLRHMKRSILKDVGPIVVTADNQVDVPHGSLFGRAVYSAGNLAASLFTGLPFSGEVNVLTTSAFAPGGLWSAAALPRGVAYLHIGAPTSAGDWSVRAAMSEGDVASWVLAGSFVSRAGSAHAYTFGLSYSTQEYQGGNPAALAAVTDGSRNVGEVYAFDRWTLSRAVSVEYGGRYTRYDYLKDRGLLSPRLGVTVEPLKGTRVTAAVAQRMIAPGAEEFLSRGVTGPWLPPERTFAPLGAREMQVERARSLDVSVEQSLAGAYLVSVRRFLHDVDDQLVTLFDVNLPDGPRSLGHYYVTNAGAVEAGGWGVRFSSPETRRLRAAIDYTITQARWMSRGDVGSLQAWAPAALRPDEEDIHDITTTVQTEIPETATRVFVLYKINSAYTRGNADLTRPGLDGRFDVQVNQALPFALRGTQWEVLIGLRNLFRDPNDRASVYDELLVVRPPKRVVGGFLVKF